MDAGLQDQVAFHLTGRRRGAGLQAVDEFGLRPALLAHYRDLTQLRYDFPLVLVTDAPADGRSVQSLSAVVDDVVREIARADDGERLTRHTLRLERAMRAAVAAGGRGSLAAVWDAAAERLAAAGDERLRDSLARARAALTVDGEVVDCDQTTPSRVLRHLWSGVQRAKAERARADIDRLVRRLADILRVDDTHSVAGRSPERLRAGVGPAHAELFDFEAMSRLLTRSVGESALPASRRRRIEQLLAVLRSQRFFPAPAGSGTVNGDVEPHAFEFHDCGSALAAYRERLPEAVDLARAMAMAELEIDGRYREAEDDPLFADYGAHGLDAEEMARFPAYLVVLDAAQLRGTERDTLMEMLSAGLPVNVLVQSDDLVEESGIGGDGELAVGLRSRQLTGLTIGLNDVFVLQASASHLYRSRERILAGLAGTGPALFSVYSGASAHADGFPPYLVAAAATESRAFPAFSYDPAAGADWAARFSLAGNAQAERDWPVQPFVYEDEEHQRVETELAFTLVDFMACDRRFSAYFARLPRADWNGGMVPVAESVDQGGASALEQVPGILMVDGENMLQHVIVEDRLIEATRRCRDAWHSLQELGGIHNSHAERVLARERAIWEAEAQARQSAATNAAAPAPAIDAAAAAVPATPVAEEVPAEEPARSSDEAWVETARCTTCNECTQINNKMFAYDENKQCHIVDLNAGTYRDLVEAAENCQVAIIHPGKPRNPNEPGLEELIKRAEAFQ